MESKKENICVTIDSKIPLPKSPLPALPKHLTKKSIKIKPLRPPLKTISQSTANCVSSTPKVEAIQNIRDPIETEIENIDARHVNTRRGSTVLDLQFNFFNDEYIKIKSDDKPKKDKKKVPDLSEKKNLQEPSLSFTPVGTKKVGFLERNCAGSSLALTPSIQSIEHKGIRNVKKSLKRPHSRELQGLSPSVSEKRNSDERVKRQLQFELQSSGNIKGQDYWMKCYTECLSRDYTDAMFEHLLEVERLPLAVPKLQCHSRSCIINWLINVNVQNGNPTVIQTACWFFDSFLSKGSIPVDKLQLVSTACYWIALKIHGPVVSSSKLVRWASDAFRKDTLLKAEKFILKKLNFPSQPVVPQDFITYLSWCVKDQTEEIEVASTFICLSGLMVEKFLCEVYPSVIAAASVRNAVVLLGRGELLKALESCPVYRAAAKKTSNMALVTSALRRAVRAISEPLYEYRAPLQYFGIKSRDVIEKILRMAAVMDGTVPKSKLPVLVISKT